MAVKGAARGLSAVFALTLLGACVRLVPEGGGAPRPSVTPPQPTQPVTGSALTSGVRRGPAIGSLGLTQAGAGQALASFVESCPRLLSRNDASGLTRREDWRQACSAASTWGRGNAASFFATHFETAQIGDGSAYATGYYEPEIAGSRVPSAGYNVPVYAMPPDLVRGWYDDMPQTERTGRQPLGRYDASGRFVPYFERAEIENGALAGKGLEIAWAKDPVEFFFLQIQGSGRLRLPDGNVIRIGYAGQNGREYAGIGSLMRERGLIGSGPGQYPGSMQGIMAYLRDNPEQGRALMRENKSWVFFRILEGDGPLGALSVPVRRRASVAADPAFVPLGAPVWLKLDRAEANGLWVAQDTGGAIKGANRFDTFWGAGEDARRIAGGMSGRGQALIFLPRGVLARIGAK